MKTSANAFKVPAAVESLRYGEAASYRSSRWLHVPHDLPWIRHKSRNVWPFTRLFTVINASRSITSLSTDWDEAGSSAVTTETWERATELIKRHAEFLWSRRGIILPSPRILPGPDGSVDIHWKTTQRELLLNVPANPTESATYYGDDFGSDRKKGDIQPGALDMSLFLWLTTEE